MLSEKDIEQYEANGFLAVEGVLSAAETDALEAECGRLLDGVEEEAARPSFVVSGGQQAGDDYFLTSGDKIRFFFEEKGFDPSGKPLVDKRRALDKIGHALHWLNPKFKAVTFSDKIKAIARDLHFVDPVVVQSMYIFKHPKIGGEVQPHRDATYLYTDPPSCVGFWLPLEDATLDNGCLYFVPGSHRDQLTRRMIRNPEKNGPLLTYTGSEQEYSDDEYVPVPVKRGSLVLIHGLVMHKSGQNATNKSRDVYTFHITENFQVKYSSENWLQPTPRLPFPSLYETDV